MTYTFNQETGKIVTADKQSKAKEQKGYIPRVAIIGEQLENLKQFAKADGVKLLKKNKAGKQVQDDWALKQAVEIYTKAAVSAFIESRQANQ